MHRVELHDRLPGGAFRKKLLIAPVGEHPLDEIFTQVGIAQSSLFLNGNQGELIHEGPREDADALAAWRARSVVQPHTFDTAAR